jgi:hypothetical protein
MWRWSHIRESVLIILLNIVHQVSIRDWRLLPGRNPGISKDLLENLFELDQCRPVDMDVKYIFLLLFHEIEG